MDLSKGSRFFEAYGKCWALMKEYNEPKDIYEYEDYLRKAKELRGEYSEYANFVEAALCHYGVLIRTEMKEKYGDGSSKRRKPVQQEV